MSPDIRQGALERAKQILDDVHKITCPTLILRGDRSDVFTDENAAKFASACRMAAGSRSPNAGHTIQGDNPAGLLGALQSRSSRRASGSSFEDASRRTPARRLIFREARARVTRTRLHPFRATRSATVRRGAAQDSLLREFGDRSANSRASRQHLLVMLAERRRLEFEPLRKIGKAQREARHVEVAQNLIVHGATVPRWRRCGCLTASATDSIGACGTRNS